MAWWHGALAHLNFNTRPRHNKNFKFVQETYGQRSADPRGQRYKIASGSSSHGNSNKKKGSNKQIIYDQLDAWWPFKLWTDFSEGNRRRGVNCPISNCNCNCTIYTGVYMYLYMRTYENRWRIVCVCNECTFSAIWLSSKRQTEDKADELSSRLRIAVWGSEIGNGGGGLFLGSFVFS